MHLLRLADPPAPGRGRLRRPLRSGAHRYNPPSLRWPGSVPARGTVPGAD